MPERTLSFGRYRLEPQGGLMSGARNVHLTPKALALLSFIAERPGEVVTKDQLFGAVWPEVNVGDAALVTCIQELRQRAEGRRKAPPLYRDPASPRLPFRRENGFSPASGRQRRRRGQSGPRTAAARPSFDRACCRSPI